MSVDKIDLTPENFNALVNENGNKFNSTILEIFSKRADNVEPSNLLNNYQRKSSLYEPSKIDPRVYNEISNIFFDTVSKDFDCIELSPISPLGLNSVLTATNQNNVLSASRNSEVISDSAIAMALECAYRKKVLKEKIINLASSTRILRTQSYSKGKKSHWSQHFRACSLISSFRNSGYKLFEMFVFQIHNWLNVLENLKDKIVETLAEEYISKNQNSVGLNALQHYRKEYGMEIQDDEIKKQYSNYLQNALASIASANSSTTK